jgi:RNA polymerase sigma-70 factor (ECF subfamily)
MVTNAAQPGTDEDERALIARIASGDRPAFEQFYHAYVRRAYAFAYAIVGVPELAEEIAGDTMIEIWKSAHRYRGKARVSTWVFAIAHHRSLDAMRRKRFNVVPLDAAPVPAAYDPPAAPQLGDESAELDAALATLSPDHRAVLELTYIYDCTQAEIATIVNAPVATVKTRIFNAKRNLRAALDRTSSQKDVS